MKKLLVFLLAIMAVAMMAFLSFDRGVRGDLYYSETRPNIQLKIDRTLQYLGETDYLRGRLKAQAYMWLTPDISGPWIDKMFIIEHSTVHHDVAHLTTSDLFRGMPHFTRGKTLIGDTSYQYVFYITEPGGDNFWTEFIKGKGFVLNRPKLTACFGRISTDTAWTKFYYMRSYDPEKNFRGPDLTDSDRALIQEFLATFKRDIQYRGKFKR